jgi:hypothetical protein
MLKKYIELFVGLILFGVLLGAILSILYSNYEEENKKEIERTIVLDNKLFNRYGNIYTPINCKLNGTYTGGLTANGTCDEFMEYDVFKVDYLDKGKEPKVYGTYKITGKAKLNEWSIHIPIPNYFEKSIKIEKVSDENTKYQTRKD